MTIQSREDGASGAPVTPAAAADATEVQARRTAPRPKAAGTRRWTTAAWLQRYWYVTPVAIFAVSRVAQLLVLLPFLPSSASVKGPLLRWDTKWLLQIARDGYPASVGAHEDFTGSAGGSFAFFPGYPMAVRAVHLVVRDWEIAAIAVAWISAAVAATLVFALARALYDDRVAFMLTALFCTQPLSMVFSLAYSDAFFLALAFGALLAAYRQRWLLAGGLSFAAGLSRATGVAVALALVTAAVMYARKREHGRQRWVALAGAAIGTAGVPAYIAWVGVRFGDPAAWFRIQQTGWGTQIDFGRSVYRRIIVRGLFHSKEFVLTSVALLLIVAAVATVIAIWMRVWPPLLVYGLVILALVYGQAGPYGSKARLMVPALITLIPAAISLARARLRMALAMLILFSFLGLWYGAYMVTLWPNAP